VRYGSIGGVEYEVPQSRLYCLCINVALCSTALQCICRVIRRSSMTMKAHTYYIIFRRPPIGGSFPPSPPCGATEPCHSWSSNAPFTPTHGRCGSKRIEYGRRREYGDSTEFGQNWRIEYGFNTDAVADGRICLNFARIAVDSAGAVYTVRVRMSRT